MKSNKEKLQRVNLDHFRSKNVMHVSFQRFGPDCLYAYSFVGKHIWFDIILYTKLAFHISKGDHFKEAKIFF